MLVLEIIFYTKLKKKKITQQKQTKPTHSKTLIKFGFIASLYTQNSDSRFGRNEFWTLKIKPGGNNVVSQ